MPVLLQDRRVLALLLAASLTILSNTLISPALPGIEASFPDQSDAGLLTRLLVTAPSLMVALCASFAGAMADRFGKRRQLLAGVALFALAGSSAMFLPSLPLILVSRLVLGVAVAMIMTAQTALIGDYFSGDLRVRFMGMQIAATNFGGFVFLALAGWIAGIEARLTFGIYAIALLYLPLMWMALTEPARHAHGMHAEGAGGESSWPLKLAAAVALAGLSFVTFYLLPTQAPYFLRTIGHPEPTATAILLATVPLAGGAVSLTYARVRGRFGRALTPALGFACMAAGYGLLATAHGFALALPAAVLIGISTGLVMPTFITIALDVSPPHRRGLAAGAITTSVYLGQFISPLISQPLIQAVGFAKTFALTAGVLALLGVTSWLSFRDRVRSGE